MTSARHWYERLFSTIDAKNSQGFAQYLTAEAVFRFGNTPPVTGTTRIIQALDQFFASVAALEHRLSDFWDLPEHRICRGTVHYTRLDGDKVIAPFCNVFTMDHGKVARYEIYLDPTGLFAPR
jgi:ketosteroid isomerase-like protein